MSHDKPFDHKECHDKCQPYLMSHDECQPYTMSHDTCPISHDKGYIILLIYHTKQNS